MSADGAGSASEPVLVPLLIEERRGRIAVLTLNRPAQRNSLSEGLIAALQAA
ncbi:MAG: enoyl-CoA hydratase, partial [Hyphomicrobium sp.]